MLAISEFNRPLVTWVSWDVHQAYLSTALGLDIIKWEDAPDDIKEEHIDFVKFVIKEITVKQEPFVTKLPTKKVCVACINSLVKVLSTD